MTTPLFSYGDKKYTKSDDFGDDMLMPYAKFVDMTADGNPFSQGIPRAIFADVAGTATIIDAYGVTHSGFPLNKGENRIMISAISSLATTTKVFGAF